MSVGLQVAQLALPLYASAACFDSGPATAAGRTLVHGGCWTGLISRPVVPAHSWGLFWERSLTQGPAGRLLRSAKLGRSNGLVPCHVCFSRVTSSLLIVSCHVVSRRVVSGCVSSSRVMFVWFVFSRPVMPSLLVSRPFLSGHVTSCCVRSCHLFSCHVLSVSSRVMKRLALVGPQRKNRLIVFWTLATRRKLRMSS